MKIAYFDMINGASGDMILASLLDAGLKCKLLKEELSKLNFKDIELKKHIVKRKGFTATKFNIKLKQNINFNSPNEMVRVIQTSKLDEEVKNKSIQILEELVRTESKIHETNYKNTHHVRKKDSCGVKLHQLQSVDTIIDIVGACIGIKFMKIEKLFCSNFLFGCGWINSREHPIPIPAPATVELLKGYPAVFTNRPNELTTPTAAAILTAFCKDSTTVPLMNIKNIGYGAGDRDDREFPNILRLIIGDACRDDSFEDSIFKIETNIDDMNPVGMEHLFEKLFTQGALDVYLTSCIMKKSRPGLILTVLSPENSKDEITDRIFEETTTFGVRICSVNRKKLARKIEEVTTDFGVVRVKIGSLNGKVMTISPEFQDCKRLAKLHNISFRTIYEQAKVKALPR